MADERGIFAFERKSALAFVEGEAAPGVNIPLWIVEQANQRYLPLMLNDMELYAKEKIRF